MTWILLGLFAINVGLTIAYIYLSIQTDENQREIEALEDWIVELEAAVALEAKRRG